MEEKRSNHHTLGYMKLEQRKTHFQPRKGANGIDRYNLGNGDIINAIAEVGKVIYFSQRRTPWNFFQLQLTGCSFKIYSQRIPSVATEKLFGSNFYT